MYSGVYPNKHGMWFLWHHSPETSPFQWLKKWQFLNYFDCLPLRLGLHMLTARKVKRTAYWGIPRIVNLPLKYWPDIDVTEKKFWDEDGYLEPYPTVFEILRANQVPFDAVGLVKTTWETSRVVAEHNFTDIKPWTYLFIGDTDIISHLYVQESPEAVEKIKALDGIVERVYREFEAKVGDFDCFVFSDHGHVRIEEKINLYEVFQLAGDNLNGYKHLLDSNFARFWFRSDFERQKVEAILSHLKHGFILSDEDLKRLHVDMGGTQFGELVFYLDAGSAFTWTTFDYGNKQKSMHGYLPDHAECDGIFLSNRPIAVDGHVELVDILPSTLSLLGLPVPPHVEGRSVWG